MTPYYEHGGVSIFHGDCREVLPALAEKADCCVTDPPYGETSLPWDSLVPGWPAAVAGALTPLASLWVFGSMRALLASAGALGGWRFVQDLVWEKHNGSNTATDRFRRVHELIAHFVREDAIWGDVFKAPVKVHDAMKNRARRGGSSRADIPHWGIVRESDWSSEEGGPRLMRSVIFARSCHREAVRPTQKPVPVVTPLVQYSCPPGGLVLDPFMGSGTTLVVARSLGMRAIGVDSDEASCEMAVARLAQEPLALGAAS